MEVNTVMGDDINKVRQKVSVLKRSGVSLNDTPPTDVSSPFCKYNNRLIVEEPVPCPVPVT
eukprot:3757965-Ditylum_brightwellii.AAC.1